MAIKMMEREMLAEGVYTFTVMDAEYDEKFEKLKIKFESDKGDKHTESFLMIDGKKRPIEWQVRKMTYFVRTILDSYDLDELTQEVVADMIGRSITAEVVHFKADNGNTYINFKNLKSVETPVKTKKSTKAKKVEDDDFEFPFDI